MQGDFLIEILKRCKEEKIHTAIETSFYTSLELIKKALPYLDLIYIDLKLFDEKKHQKYTGVSSKIIKENIRYGNLDATDEEVYTAAQEAQVDHFVRTLADGYDTVLNEETSNVSQGQKQLLTIARAILADPKIMILDEATSSVDTRTEVLIQQALDQLMEGRTSFIIAHRLSTIRNADMILVMDKGDIIEVGNHEELIAKDGFYATLYNSQFSED